AYPLWDLKRYIFNSTIPLCLGTLSFALTVLSLNGNNFHGKIPKTFLDGNNMETLELSQNKLQRNVPKSLIKWKALEVLNLGHNQISDVFPCWLQIA
ncbi:LRR domain containing protein, partial [Parasponia andersonii]